MRLPRILAATAAALTLTIAGCASPDAGSGRGFNDADVDFAVDMIQHHAQALTMVDLTLGRDLDADVARLTEEIRAAQAPEIETMTEWLDDWDQPIPATSRDHANAHGDGDEMDADMPGMMSAEEMTALEEAPDAEFQNLWLQMMIEHHEGAVNMATEQLDHGENEQAIALAEKIIAAQEKEIDTMQALLEG